jgi:hypothetical protein
MTVSGRTITSAERQLSQTVASVAQSNRSDGVSLGALDGALQDAKLMAESQNF